MSTDMIDFSAAVSRAASCVAKPHTAETGRDVKLASKWHYFSGSAIWTVDEERILAEGQRK